MLSPPPANLGNASWRTNPTNVGTTAMPVVGLGNGNQRVKPTQAAVVTPPITTGSDPSWRPNRAD
ncbi:hypothetical protein BH11ACT6_BH11ACT6_05080 [soil metagenome]